MKNFLELAEQYSGLTLTSSQIEQFKKLAFILMEANKTTNLTAIRDEEGIYLKHFLDSLTLIQALPEHTRTLADVGSGAGFPGLVIAITCPEIKIIMIESVGKKTDFIEHAIKELHLKNAHVLRTRVESLAQDIKYAHRYDAVTARAVAFLPILVQYCLPLVRKDGIFIAMKSTNQTEIDEAKKELEKQGAFVQKQIPISIPGLSPRELIVIKKA